MNYVKDGANSLRLATGLTHSWRTNLNTHSNLYNAWVFYAQTKKVIESSRRNMYEIGRMRDA